MLGVLSCPQSWLLAGPGSLDLTGTAATDTEFSETFTKASVDLFLLPSHMLKALNCILPPFRILLTFSFVMQSSTWREWLYCLQLQLIFNLLATVTCLVRSGFCKLLFSLS